MKRSTVLLALLALPLAACGGGTDPSASTSAGATPNATVGSSGDAFCDLALLSIEPAREAEVVADNLTALFEDPAFLTSTDAGPLNELGEELLAYSESAAAFYTQAIPLVDDPAVAEALAGMADFVAQYTLALGEAAVSAGSPLEFFTEIGTTFSDPAVLAVAETAPVYAETIATYAETTCGITVDVGEE